MAVVTNVYAIIGIDPGEFNGIAFILVEKGECHFFTKSFWNTIDFLEVKQIEAMVEDKVLQVIIEDPNIIAGLFARYFHKLKETKGVVGAVSYVTKIAQNVGMNKQSAKLLMAYLEKKGIPYEAIIPEKKKKIIADNFFLFTGIQGISQHCRDAFMLLLRKGLVNTGKLKYFKNPK